MYRELLAMVYLAGRLGLDDVAAAYRRDAEDLRRAVDQHCWDERDGFYYTVDLNLRSKERVHGFGVGMPRNWDTLIQRLDVWSGFLPLWAGLASPEQAARVVERRRDTRSFNSPWGVRTLSRLERMFDTRASNNPSSWLGPIWGASNHLVYAGLLRYGYVDEAQELAEKTVRLFGRDLERHAVLHEYYDPETGEPNTNPGFQDWNYLVLNMIAWLEGRRPVAEF
jgi:putative isomerase